MRTGTKLNDGGPYYAEGKAWRERNKPAQDQTPEQPATDAIQTTQLDLWEKR